MNRQRFKFLTSDESKIFQKNCKKAKFCLYYENVSEKHKLVCLKLRFHVLPKVDSGI